MDELGKTGGPYLTLIFRLKLLESGISHHLFSSFHLAYTNIVDELTNNVPALNFVYTLRDFQPDQALFPLNQYYFVGPACEESAAPQQSEHGPHPLVYLSMGTMINQSLRFYRRCIAAFDDKDVTLIISLGARIRPEPLGILPDNIQVFAHVDQIKVLQTCDLFITHDGMNSVHEAMYYGVPMIVIPVGNDQPTVARRVQETGLGEVCTAKQASSDELYRTAMRMLVAPPQAAVQRMSERAHRAGGNRWITDVIEQTFMPAIRQSPPSTRDSR